MNPTDSTQIPSISAAGVLSVSAPPDVSLEIPFPDMPCAAAPEEANRTFKGEL